MVRRLGQGLVLAWAIALLVIGGQTWRSALTSAPPAAVTVTLSGWGASRIEQTLLRQVLNEFEASHPGIRVKYEVIADQYMDVIKTRLIGEAAPDVFYLDALDAPLLMEHAVLEPLEPYLTPGDDREDFAPSLLASFIHNGHIYGLPKDYSTLALFYNKQAFAEAGINEPPSTWDQLRRDAQALTLDRNGDGRVDQYGYGELPELARQAHKIMAYGGQLVDRNGDAAFASDAALQGLALTVDQYRSDRTSAQKSDVGTQSGSEMFGQGKVAMVIEGCWAIAYLQDTFPALDFGTAEIPTINGNPNTTLFTVAYVMNRQSSHKAEAWELIAYLTGKAGMQRWTGSGFTLPSRQSVAMALGYDQDPLRSPLVKGVDYAYPWQVGAYPSAIMNPFDNQFVSAMLGQQSLHRAMQRAQQEANQQLAALQQ